jgi:hypothetical protein
MGLDPSTTVLKHPCVTCQRRKVKCDRLDPCTRCLRTGQECTQPDAQRAPRRRARRTEDANVMDRLRQLENSLEQMRGLVAKSKQKSENGGAVDSDTDQAKSLVDSLGRVIIDDEKTHYIAGSSWTNLADQVAPN